MMHIKRFIPLLCLLAFMACKNESSSAFAKADAEVFLPKTNHQLRTVIKAEIAPTVDGLANDPVWEQATWHALDQRWIGEPYHEEDFQGRYKLAWTPEGLYLLAEINDDVLYDQHKNPLELWWDDDCLEVFLDADNSGGGHQFTHNAFAYHVALDGNVVDLAPGEVPTLYNSHVESAIQTEASTSLWELKILVFDDTFKDGGVNEPKILKANDTLGFALAYCDNDGSAEREHFIGSVEVPGEDKNRGWIDAGIFGTIVLTE
ncbi:sugar-binding protein [Croceiramulus getboli]|nr:sugar-binding protein [Flavobacteriaceae bacterium YJPT1-3]